MMKMSKFQETADRLDNLAGTIDAEIVQTAAMIRARHNDMVEAVILTCIVVVVGVAVIAWAATEARR